MKIIEFAKWVDPYEVALDVNILSACLTLYPTALSTAKTLWSFGRSECNRVKGKYWFYECNVTVSLQ